METAMRVRMRNTRQGHRSTVAAEGSRGGEKGRAGDLEVSMGGGGEASGGGGFGLNGHWVVSGEHGRAYMAFLARAA
jgi:hypothetical protein